MNSNHQDNSWDDGLTLVKKHGHLPRIGRIEGERFTFPLNPQSIINDMRGYSIDLFTFMQHPAVEQVRFDYPMELDNMAILPISTFEHWKEKQVGNKFRKWLRLARENGVSCAEVPWSESLLLAISNIYNETPIRQGRKFGHYRMPLEKLREYAETFDDRSFFLAARLNDQIVAFAKVVTNEEGDFGGLLHILGFQCHQGTGVMQALLAALVQSCQARGIRQLGYGQWAYGNKTGDGLQEFKQRAGFERVDVPRYWVPLTLRGRVSLALGMQHRWRERMPEWMAARLRRSRTWLLQKV